MYILSSATEGQKAGGWGGLEDFTGPSVFEVVILNAAPVAPQELLGRLLPPATTRHVVLDIAAAGPPAHHSVRTFSDQFVRAKARPPFYRVAKFFVLTQDGLGQVWVGPSVICVLHIVCQLHKAGTAGCRPPAQLQLPLFADCAINRGAERITLYTFEDLQG